jgi:hypothetical protein
VRLRAARECDEFLSSPSSFSSFSAHSVRKRHNNTTKLPTSVQLQNLEIAAKKVPALSICSLVSFLNPQTKSRWDELFALLCSPPLSPLPSSFDVPPSADMGERHVSFLSSCDIIEKASGPTLGVGVPFFVVEEKNE